MMEVTYNTYDKKNKLVLGFKKAACFSSLYRKDFHHMEVLVQCHVENQDIKEWWMELIKRIHPSAKIIKKKGHSYMRFRSVPEERRSQQLLILSALRYLWETRYTQIPRWTKVIMDKYPDIDPLKAIIIANSNLFDGTTGHSIVPSADPAKVLRGVWHYRRYKGKTVHGFTCAKVGVKEGYGSYQYKGTLIDERTDCNDLGPILKHYGYK